MVSVPVPVLRRPPKLVFDRGPVMVRDPELTFTVVVPPDNTALDASVMWLSVLIMEKEPRVNAPGNAPDAMLRLPPEMLSVGEGKSKKRLLALNVPPLMFTTPRF